MIEYRTGDILTTDAEALVNTVNCVGIMGRGIALQFKNAFPANFKAYAAACKRGEVQPGRMFVFETGTLGTRNYIINFPTKRHWRGKSRMEDIESGLVALAQEIRERGIRSIAVPPLGSGLGGLNWPDVRARIEAALRGFNDVQIVVFEPNGAPDRRSWREDGPRDDAGPRRAGGPDVPLSRRADGPVRHAARSTQAHVLHAGGRAAAAAAIRRGRRTGRTPRTCAMCCAQSKASGVRLRGWRRRPESSLTRSGRGEGRRGIF